MEINSIKTQFATAERASDETIIGQYKHVIDQPFFQQILDGMPEIVLIVNDQRQIVFANRPMLDLLGLNSRETACGFRPGEILGCIHSNKTQGKCGTSNFCKTCGAVNSILKAQQGQSSINECRITSMLDTIEALDLRIYATPITVGNAKFTLLAVKDISDEKRRRFLERIFFHDVLNTAGSVLNLAELLKGQSISEVEPLIDLIYTTSKSLIEEIDAQKQLTAAENNELSVTQFDILSIDVLSTLLYQFQNHQVALNKQIQIDPKAEKIIFVSDMILIRRVLGNMLKNALEAIHTNEKVTMGCCKSDTDFIEFWIHNPGYIPEDIQNQIFQRSFSTKSQYGRGLGTYSMRLLTEKYLKGKIAFSSTQEDGTIFKAIYPLHIK